MNNEKKTFYKNKHNLLSPEDVKEGVLLACTFNPKDQKHDKVTDRRTLIIKALCKRLAFCNVEYYLFPELSRLGRVHFHGYIRLRDISHFYLSGVPRLIDDYTIDIQNLKEVPTSKYKSWFEYCVKQQHLWMDYPLKFFRLGITLKEIQGGEK